MNNSLLVGYKLKKKFGNRLVLDDLTFSLKEGEIVALLGPNGAGKTTTFSILAGIIPPTSGKIFFLKEDITNYPIWRRARKGIIYLPQGSSLFLGMSTEENILSILELNKKTKEEKEALKESLLLYFDLQDVRRQKAYSLSGGEKKRLELARALATSPKCLLLDEPFSALDPKGTDKLKEILLSLKNDKAIGILLTDHNIYDTLSLVDRAYIIHHGRLLYEGTKEELLSSQKVKEIYLPEKFIPI